ncbi:response regulator [Parasphingorhabdus halotolerans]|uniref:Response regulator n=1 Tax=Parasphingorhabdus halotolerans TaxID=2725558 RepID=A0A6H2DPM2_9SPHN|nr:response regulator [Parasphingorhabdus halotolerans]QJB70284.1 response regulator [Parasphingorhabdus halotolerans]
MSLSESLKPHLPYLRRYARALTGSQKSGDTFVKATLETIVADPSVIARDNARVGLYRIFSGIWESANVDTQTDGEDADGQDHLNKIPPVSRQVLLLTALEGFSIKDVAKIADVGQNSVNGLLEDAIADIDEEMRSDVLIIEDEALISMELEQIVTDLGHCVCGTATTHKGALAAVEKAKPSLVLADIQLADGSSGIDAVNDILNQFSVPVIFITAFPERLLTGERPEPTFLITKPFQPNAIRAAISQALFFSPTKQEAKI